MALSRRQVIGAFTGAAVAAGAAFTPLTAQAEPLVQDATYQEDLSIYAQALKWSRLNDGLAVSLSLGTAFIQPEDQVREGLKQYLASEGINSEVFIKRNENEGSVFSMAFHGHSTELFDSIHLQEKLNEHIKILKFAQANGLTPASFN